MTSARAVLVPVAAGAGSGRRHGNDLSRPSLRLRRNLTMWQPLLSAAATATACLLLCQAAAAQDKPAAAAPAAEAGIADKYPGDAGIASDPDVLFAEDFESGNLAKWDDRDGNRPPKVALVADKALVHAGKQAVQLAVEAGKGVGADLVKWLPPNDQVYARWYCRFAEDYDQGNLNHTGGNLVALRDRNTLGMAGIKPDGTDRFTTGLEPWRDWKRNPPPGELAFYTYYVDQKRDPDGNWWGNLFRPPEKSLPERGRWHCLEMMVKANAPDKADGEQAFWVDGRLRGRFSGIRWRTTDALKINGFWLLLYIHDNPQTNRIWIDDVVVAKRYIGPMKK
jgi:hypothetical protein